MRRHDLDLLSLVTGLVFVGIAFGHILDVGSDFDLNGRWIVPVVLVALGVAGLAGILRPKDDRADAPAVADAVDAPTRPTRRDGAGRTRRPPPADCRASAASRYPLRVPARDTRQVARAANGSGL